LYSALGYAIEGLTMTTTMRLEVSGPNAVVDWVMVELRDAVDPSIVLERRVGLLQRNGVVVRPDNGNELLPFCAPAGDHHVAVRHRNHLGCMTAEPWGLGPLPAPIHFMEPSFATWGANAQRTIQGRMTLWPGNALDDNVVKYTGEDNDRDQVLSAIGGVVPTSVVVGYHTSDINLDGLVKYTGEDNDRDRILQTIGGIVPTAVRVEQVP